MDLVWAPHVVQNLDDSELELYLEFSCTACIPGGCNVEKALEVLYQSNGDIKLAIERLLENNFQEQNNNNEQDIWYGDEVNLFERLIMLHGKDFFQISQDLKTKTVKKCIEFYYLWKKSPLKNLTTPTISVPQPTDEEEFPCKVCGRVFSKIKSRSAHMKRHKNGR